MSQLTITNPATRGTAPGGRRTRPMRSERMVSLRSAMPLGLVTLRHDIPERLRPEMPVRPEMPEYLNETTPKVDPAECSERSVAETPARKGA